MICRKVFAVLCVLLASCGQERPSQKDTAAQSTCTLVTTPQFRNQSVCYQNIGGRAIAEGDILLGAIAEKPNGSIRTAVARSDRSYLWVNGVVPYEFDPDFAGRKTTMRAISHFHKVTPLKFRPRTNQKDYIKFDACPVYSR
ncbi:MAG: hypothetical protein HY537_02985 [Deltaproteobacteria bacterium]|nr:hypothetical protein [Deltaproteobacteria bacterium]